MTGATAWDASPASYSGLSSGVTYYVQCLAANFRGSVEGSIASATTSSLTPTGAFTCTYSGTTASVTITTSFTNPASRQWRAVWVVQGQQLGQGSAGTIITRSTNTAGATFSLTFPATRPSGAGAYVCHSGASGASWPTDWGCFYCGG